MKTPKARHSVLPSAIKVVIVLGVTLASAVAMGKYPVLTYAQAQDPTSQTSTTNYIEGKVLEITETKQIPSNVPNTYKTYQKIRVKVFEPGNTKIIETDNNAYQLPKPKVFSKGDRVVLMHTQVADTDTYFVTDFVRRGALNWLLFLFVISAIIVGKKQGLYSIISVAISFLIVFKLVVPTIARGSNPIFITLVASAIIIPVTFYMSHGFSTKTNVAIAGTLVSLIFTMILALIFVKAGKLSGFSTDEAMFLQIRKGAIDMKNLLLSGIIIGTLGVLDDVTVSQASLVAQLKKANARLGATKLFEQAMSVGKDHISSMINTLVLVYAGASFPLLLLFVNSDRTFSQIINYEMLAEEIIRTLVGSIGLIMAVPITTFLAVLVETSKTQ